MTDLMKRLRASEHPGCREAANEIEHLEHRLRFYKNIHEKGAQQAVIEDMRAWARSKGYADHTISFPALDAYAKDRGIE